MHNNHILLAFPNNREENAANFYMRAKLPTEATILPLCETVNSGKIVFIASNLRNAVHSQVESCIRTPATRDQNSQSEILSKDHSELWRIYKQNPHNIETRNALIEAYLPLVRVHALRLHSRLPKCIDIDDMISAGVFGLMDAISAFDINQDVTFEVYCVRRIRGAMLDELRKTDTLPRLMRAKASRLNTIRETLLQKLGHPATLDELAASFDVDSSTMERMIIDTTPRKAISLSTWLYETESMKGVREVDLIADKKSHEPSEGISLLETLRALLRGLNDTERIIIICYYFLEMTMEATGEHVDLSLARISQLHRKILRRLEDSMEWHANHCRDTEKSHIFQERV